MTDIILFQTDEVYHGKILKRPSKLIKSPYVADVLLDDKEILAHSPSLGCCGLADQEANVLMTKNKGKNVKTEYKIEFSVFEEYHNDKYNKQIIALNPKIAEKVGYNAIINNCINDLKNIKEIKTEKVFGNSRFDICGKDENDIPFICEIKTVPLADYVDMTKKDRLKNLELIKNKNINQKISYFPDGYRKNKNEPVSPRALKHIQELEKIKLEEDNIRCILLFVVQRIDVEVFQTSNLDQIYKDAVKKAYDNGVEIKVIQIKWNELGTGYFYSNNLRINLD